MNKTVSEIVGLFSIQVAAGEDALTNVINDVYICDLLSWVMGRAPEESAWITIQGHINIIAVAMLAGVSCIIVAEGAEVNEDTIAKANEEGIPLLRSELSAYQIASEFARL